MSAKAEIRLRLSDLPTTLMVKAVEQGTSFRFARGTSPGGGWSPIRLYIEDGLVKWSTPEGSLLGELFIAQITDNHVRFGALTRVGSRLVRYLKDPFGMPEGNLAIGTVPCGWEPNALSRYIGVRGEAAMDGGADLSFIRSWVEENLSPAESAVCLATDWPSGLEDKAVALEWYVALRTWSRQLGTSNGEPLSA